MRGVRRFHPVVLVCFLAVRFVTAQALLSPSEEEFTESDALRMIRSSKGTLAPVYGPLAEQMKHDRVEAVYSAPRSADDLILERIAADSAPRRLTVVSSDRELRRAGRRRRCKLARSEEFADTLISASDRPPPRAPAEPPEKRHGCLTPAETQAWMRELGLSEEDAERPQQEP